MGRELTTVEEERARLAKGTPEPNYLERKRELYERQVSEFTHLLLPDVRQALEHEATSDVAEDWLDEARRVLREVLPESRNIEVQPEFQASLQRVRTGLTDSLLKEALAPTAAEIEEHARELAQLVLGNWFAILEHTQTDDSGEMLTLNANGLPEAMDQVQLYEGIEAFVISKDQVVSHFIDYLGSLTKYNPFVEIAPDRYLVRKGTCLHLVRSKETVKRLLEPKEEPTQETMGWFELVRQAVEPFLNSTPRRWGRTANLAAAGFIDATLEREIAIAAAYQVARGVEAPFVGPLEFLIDLTLEQEKISTELAEYAVLDLKQVTRPGAIPSFRLRNQQIPVMRRILVEAGSLTNEHAVDSLRRVSVTAAAFIFSGATAKAAPQDFDLRAVESFVCGSAEGSEFFKISVRATQHALEMTDRQMLTREFRTRLGRGFD